MSFIHTEVYCLGSKKARNQGEKDICGKVSNVMEEMFILRLGIT